MKKSVIAAVLAMSVLFCACSKKASESSTESETTASSSDTSATTSEKETETSAEPTDTSKVDPVSYDAPAFKKAGYLSYEIEKEEAFTFLSKDFSSEDITGYNCIEFYYGFTGLPVFSGDNAGKINEAVKEDYEKILPNAKEYLEGRKKEYAEKLGTEPYGIEEEENLLPVVLRADERITTVYYPLPLNQDNEKDLSSKNLINYDTATGKHIALSDVVKDKARLVEMAKKQIMANMTEYDLETIKEADVLAALNADDVPFTIDYSGITVYFDQTITRGFSYAPAHIAYIGNEDVLNGEYFDSLPENYVLHISPKEDFYWDLDGDGKTEKICVDIDQGKQYYEMGSFTIKIDDQETKVDTSNSNGDESADTLMLIHTHGKNFLYIWVGGEDDRMSIDIFEIVGKNVEQKDGAGKWKMAPWENFDPDHVELVDEVYVVGLKTYSAVYHIDDQGMPVTDDETVSLVSYYGQIFPCLKKELKFDQVDPETLEKTGSVTLKAGTSLWPVLTDRKGKADKSFEVFKVIDKDQTKEVYVRVDLSYDADEWEATLDGAALEDVFVRVFRGA
ncbi:MAG: hypothetical protein K6E26_02905 [Clostridiales bacterium]|nr:hypothetical protein [Clostridiales bacterium]